jgi:chromosomal replication initiator protein
MEFDIAVRRALIEEIGQDRFELWFGDGVQFDLDDERLQIQTDSPFRNDRLRKVFLRDIRAALTSLGHADIEVNFVAQGHDALEPRTMVDPVPKLERSADVPLPRPNGTRIRAASQPRRGRRFRSLEAFVTGECNQLAKTSVEMVIQQPGEVSPLFIHGPTGVGKTHLVEGIWGYAKKRDRRSRVVYLSAEQFTTYFVEALKSSGLPSFRRKYRQADVLIIDDIQFFAGKQATLVELTYTIDELTREGRQLILTADRPPTQLTSLGRELTTRLTGGLVCGMKPFDPSTMESVSKRWATDRHIVMNDDVHKLIASRMHGDARQLSGVLNRLQATSIAADEPITTRMANEVIQELIPTRSRIIKLQDVRKLVGEVFGLTPESLQQDSRSRAISRPRMLAMWLARKHTGAGLHEISEFFGRRSHSSAVAAQRTVDGWLESGKNLPLNGQSCDVRDIIGQIESELRAG